MRSNEGFQAHPADATDTGTFLLKGGKYQIQFQATGYGSITLEVQSSDGTSFAAAVAAKTANAIVVADLGPGLYKFVNAASTTGIYESIVRIPND